MRDGLCLKAPTQLNPLPTTLEEVALSSDMSIYQEREKLTMMSTQQNKGQSQQTRQNISKQVKASYKDNKEKKNLFFFSFVEGKKKDLQGLDNI